MRSKITAWRCRLCALVLVLAALVSLTPVAPLQAQMIPAAEFKATMTGWQNTLDRAANRLARGELTDSDYESLRAELMALFAQARQANAAAAGERAVTQQLLDALGAPPEAGGAPETPVVAAERQRFGKILAELDGRMRQGELIATRADILIRTATDKRMKQFTEVLLQRDPLPLARETWAALPDQIAFIGERVSQAFTLTSADTSWAERVAELAGLALVGLGLGWFGRRWLLRRYGHRPIDHQPSYRERVVAMAVEGVARCLLPVVPTVAIAVALVEMIGSDPSLASLSAITTAVAGGLCFFLFFTGLAHATLAPDHCRWRLADIDSAGARSLARRITLFAAGLAMAGGAVVLLGRMLSPPELQAVVGFGTMLLATLALFSLLPGRLWARAECGAAPVAPAGGDANDADGEPEDAKSSWTHLRFLGGAVALVALGASAAGYHNLAIYIAKLSLATVAIGGVLLLIRGVLRELLTAAMEVPNGPVAEARNLLARTERGLRALEFCGRIGIDALLIMAGMAALLPLSGIDWSELKGLGISFMHGFTIGGIRLAPADILSAILLFSIIVVVTRYFQRQLDTKVLQRLQIDRGVQHSIRTGVGYLGVLAAVLISIGALGLDLSNLAMIAGALSVGIGFGLQNVVSNFVSGLILLVERPIKVGDWVVVKDKEGLVKRISVRATEIQTFQRASVIIPNSELVSSAVVNWTLKDKFGRVDVRVGVAYGSDLKLVRKVLLDCAAAHPRVARIPAPNVVFRDFGVSSLDFELRCFVSDVDFYLTTASDLRFAIAEAFEKNGITIPFSQQVLHIPQLDGLREILERSDKSANSDGTPPRAVTPAGAAD